MIVPMLRVGMPEGTLCVPALEWDAERPGLHSHAERGNDQSAVLVGMARDFSPSATNEEVEIATLIRL
ncbi:hypothetical protein F638_2718 [Pseudomonas sp. LAIL14HWK12:I2]|nr:hypothetical protein F638_2718 [Pseudomonas sp. LAIL14HWK12:I2]